MKTLSIFRLFFPGLLAIFTTSCFIPATGQSKGTWSIVASYTIPGKASGLAWDGTSVFFGIYGLNGDKVYKFDPLTGNSTLQCGGPFEDAYGLTFKSPNLVTINQPSSSSQPSQALEFNLSGEQVSSLTLPDHYMSGVAWDNGTYWVCTYYPDPGMIYHIDGQGAILSQFIPPNNQPWDICLQGSDLWIADYYGNMLYKVTSTGTLLESHPTQIDRPSGIVFDGTYLWYCDGPLGGNSTLYKVDLGGSGTPVIDIPVTSYDYGVTTMGDSATWNCMVVNSGDADLEISAIMIAPDEPISTTFVLPCLITPGASVNIDFQYSPVVPGLLDAEVHVLSNDPITPEVSLTLTGNAVFPGPHMEIGTVVHDWGEKRAGAYSRWFLSVSNNGDQPLVIDALNITDDHFMVDGSIVVPLTIETLQTNNIGIWFHPGEGISYSGVLEIGSNDTSQNPFMVNLSGTGRDTVYPVGTMLWSYLITGGTDVSPKAIHPIQDITGDGIDEVVVGSEDNHIRCFNGNASGEGDILWETEVPTGAVYSQNDLEVIMDIDMDGYQDVIAGLAWGDRSITAFSGKTGGVLWKHDTHEYGDGGWVYQVDVLYDYNDDDFPDVLAATGDDGNGTGPRRVYCLSGKTGVSIWEDQTGGPVFSVIGVEDFTGDGVPDVVCGASNSNETEGKVYGINGYSGSTLWTQSTPGTSVWALMQVDDINGDGKKDVSIGDFSGNVIMLNSVTGSQLHQLDIGNVLILRFEYMEDVNMDGHPDILVAHSGPQAIMINGYTCSNIWSKPLVDKSWSVGNIGDINQDGINDAIIGTLYSDNRVYFIDGVSGAVIQSADAISAVDAIHAIPDIVGDGTMEMVYGGRDGAIECLSGGYGPSVGIATKPFHSSEVKVRIFPNPFSSQLNFSVDLPVASGIQISLYNTYGERICFLPESHYFAGRHDIVLSPDRMFGGELKPGLYYAEVLAGGIKKRLKAVCLYK